MDQTKGTEPKNYRAELIEMAKTDQSERDKMRRGETFDAETIDRRNTERLKEIINSIGWPRISLVGEEAAGGAWLIVQHADHDTPFQEACLKTIKGLPEGEVELEEIALLEDRVRMNRKLPQLYGTQGFPNKNGEFEPFPIADPKNLEARRKKMGLVPFSDYKEAMEKIYEQILK
ncbi:hypothetical protein A3J19_04935 [Candidatus Daviesbacteria bacterium RIFCSPLOWO2_02_FULL_41_8]|nr:MAG: hypothetical protein A3J19_04935 [Candidatus Daviesbacteria bacterium RIFCSPLOWO2_02_FULL_41_8]